MSLRNPLKIGLVSLLVLSACGPNDDAGPGTSTEIAAARSGELRLGARGPEVSALQDYLTRYGYFPNESLARNYPRWRPASERLPEHGVFDAATATAIKAYQKNYALPQLGYVDAATAARIAEPRCGVPDGIPHFDPSDKFDVGTDKWNVSNGSPVLWAAGSAVGVTQAQMEAAIGQAFADWSAQSSITFRKAVSGETPQILLMFNSGMGSSYGDMRIFSGEGTGTLGIVVIDFNMAQTWSVQNPLPLGALDLKTIATHLIGDALGLKHSGFPAAVMYPSNSGFVIPLDIDDKVAISALYDQWDVMARIPNGAHDVGIGANGSIWATGDQADAHGNYGVFQFVGTGWVRSDGGATRIAVDPNGVPWAVNSFGQIFHRTTNSATTGYWAEVTGATANDIGVGGTSANPAVWIVSKDSAGTADFVPKKWNGSTWETPVDGGGAIRIAVGGDGVPWVVNSNKNIWRRTTNTTTSGSWASLPGLANDIGVGTNTASGRYAWVVSTIAVSGGYKVFVWDEQPGTASGDHAPGAAVAQNRWVEQPGAAVAISVGGDASPVAINNNLDIYREKK